MSERVLRALLALFNVYQVTSSASMTSPRLCVVCAVLSDAHGIEQLHTKLESLRWAAPSLGLLSVCDSIPRSR